ncbi:MAG TPA: porin [Dyadobacter sp.]|nr:porin [Dyadobacter sp.]
MKKKFLLACSLAFFRTVQAQDSTATVPSFSVSGYLEAYYNYDFIRPKNNTTPSFMYNFNRAGEVNLNLGFIKGAYSSERVRANLALAVGTYMNANYAAEPGVLRNIYEANAGIKLAKKANLWLDAGIMSSHIGFESAIGKDNWALTRSLVAENSPYFESGAKLNYTTDDGKLYLAALFLNGWQRIQRVDGNTTPAFGTQITYKPSAAVTLNYSTFIGNDKPDSVRQMRYYHNAYGIFQLSQKWGVTAGFDYGTEQKEKGSGSYNHWLVPVMIVRYSPTSKINLAARGEYFQDEKGVIISTGSPDGFKTWGFSANMDYAVTGNLLWRIEARTLSSKDAIFSQRDGSMSKGNTFLTTSLAISF